MSLVPLKIYVGEKEYSIIPCTFSGVHVYAQHKELMQAKIDKTKATVFMHFFAIFR